LSIFTAQIFKEDLLMATGMTKTQLVRHMAEKMELNNKQAAAFLESLAEVAIKETKKNGVFVVPGLGRLVQSNRKARMGRNPQTGEAIKIPAKVVVKFRVAKAAKDSIAPKKYRSSFLKRRPAACRPFAFQASIAVSQFFLQSIPESPSLATRDMRTIPVRISARHRRMCAASLIPSDKAAYNYLVRHVPCRR
jgi:DNA-binding protein HU-beta